MIRLNAILRRARAVRQDESGSIAVETLLMVPLLAWAFVSTLAYFDAYRAEAISTKASLTIADMISRETGFVTDEYLSGAENLLEFLTIDDDDADLRVTVIRWDEDDSKYYVVWSRERGPREDLVDADLTLLTGQLPILANNERIIVVETWTDYTPAYSVGLSEYTLKTWDFIRPRFTNQLCYKPLEATPDDDAVC